MREIYSLVLLFILIFFQGLAYWSDRERILTHSGSKHTEIESHKDVSFGSKRWPTIFRGPINQQKTLKFGSEWAISSVLTVQERRRPLINATRLGQWTEL